MAQNKVLTTSPMPADLRCNLRLSLFEPTRPASSTRLGFAACRRRLCTARALMGRQRGCRWPGQTSTSTHPGCPKNPCGLALAP